MPTGAAFAEGYWGAKVTMSGSGVTVVVVVVNTCFALTELFDVPQ
jgi:hypothetical protein